MPIRLLARIPLVVAGTAFSLIFLSLAAAAQTQPDGTFTSNEGGFSAILPGIPKQKSEPITSTNGPTVLHSFMIEENEGRSFYLVVYSDYETTLDAEASLNTVISAQLASMKGKITADKKTAVNGHPGRSVTLENEDAVFYSSVYIAGKRLYQVMYGLEKGQSLSADARKFLDSFKILI